MSDPFAPPPEDDGNVLDVAPVDAPRAPAPATRSVVREVDLPPPTATGAAVKDARDAALGTGSLILATPASLLPKPWRDRIGADYLPLTGGAIVSGLLEIAVAALLLIDGVMGTRASSVDAVIAEGGIPTHMGGMGAYLLFLFSPLGFLMMALFVEGASRIAAAVATGECFGVFPLWVAERIHAAWSRRAEDRRLGPRVVDQVTTDADGSLIIYTCRPRDWDGNTAIEHDGAFWEVVDAGPRADGARRFYIRLRPHPKGKPLRRIHRYAPDECLPIGDRVRATGEPADPPGDEKARR